MKARSLDAYLQTADELAPLAAHAARLVRLQRIFEQIAPEPLARTSQVANYKQGVVVIHAANGAVAAKLRQLLPSFRDKFHISGAEVTEIQVKVQVSPPAPKPAPTLHRELTPAARQSLERLADGLEDSPLKTALERMVKGL